MNSFITAKTTKCRECWKGLNCSIRHKKQLVIKHNYYIQWTECKIACKINENLYMQNNKLFTVNVCITADVLTCVQAGNEQVKIH